MGKRKHIALFFSYNTNWIAGSYYILNLVEALNHLSDEKKPEITVFSETLEEFEILKKQTCYAYLIFQKLPKRSFFHKAINRISYTLFRKQFVSNQKTYHSFDLVFPYPVDFYCKNDYSNKLFWIPDFQEAYLPAFFKKQDIDFRKYTQKRLVETNARIVFSSKDAQNDFFRLYPHAKNQTFVLNFAVTLPNFSSIQYSDLEKKHNLTKSYFFCANQFWAHKNHSIVLSAILKLKQIGVEPLVLFSGKNYDPRNPDHFKSLTKFIETNNLIENVRFLGFLDRAEQLCLMKNSLAIVQPSLFEGWSSVVEDAKALGKIIVLSNLKVHKEQISENVIFFDPNNADELAENLQFISTLGIDYQKTDYQKNIKDFGESFYKILTDCSIPL